LKDTWRELDINPLMVLSGQGLKAVAALVVLGGTAPRRFRSAPYCAEAG
jgi:hypothetical protein